MFLLSCGYLCSMSLPRGAVGLSVIVTFPGSDVIKLFSYSTQLSTNFQLLIKTKIPTNKEASCFKSLTC